ncbi:VOC family protein [Paenibacillus sp. CC-CFT747]|nr:VOC family protein [Paenibacillus sp. CC-CFT747]
MTHSYTPKGFQTATPYFIVQDAAKLAEFLTQAFGAVEENLMRSEEGKISHAELRVGTTILELSDAQGPFPPRTNTLHLFVEDTDSCYRKALEAGAVSLYEPGDMPYGERSAGIEDPFGNHWYLATFQRGEGKGYYEE